MSIRTVYALLLCGAGFLAAAQPVTGRFETIGVNEGLSHSSVYSILQDREGFMWFGTANGLNRYDGYKIRVYKAEDKLENPGNSNLIRGSLIEDEKRNIWFSTETGLYYLDRISGQVKCYWLFPKQKAGLVYYGLISMDEQHHLWLFNKSFGFISVNTQTRAIDYFGYPFPLPSLNMTLSDAVADREGNLWFNIYERQGFYCFNTKTKQYHPRFAGEEYESIFFGRKASYLVSKTTIYRTNLKLDITDSLPLGFVQNADGAIHNICEDAGGRVWLPSLVHGIYCYDFDRKESFGYNEQNVNATMRPNNAATFVRCDRSQNLWIGSDGGGVSKLDLKPSRFNLFPMNEEAYGLRDYFIKCIYEDDDRRIWFGTNSSGLGIYNPATATLQTFTHKASDPSSLPGNNVSTIFRDRDSNLWIGCDMGVSIFNERKKCFQKVPVLRSSRLTPGLPFVFDFYQVRNGDILAATSLGLFCITKKRNGKFVMKPEFSTSAFWCTNVIEAKDGTLWITAPLNGLFHTKRGHGRDSATARQKFFNGIDLRSMHQDERDPDVLWIASGKGLICFNTKTYKFKLYNESDGMANCYVYGILEDEHHNLWMSTNGGLSFFNRSTGTFENFTVNDGLQSNEFNTGAYFKGASGNFYFGGVKGFNWFNSSSAAKLSVQQPGVAVTSLLVNDQPVNMARLSKDTIELSYDENNLGFDVASLDFTSPAANKIFYRLEGWDHDWITTQARTVRYSNLPPGTYSFRIKALNRDGVFSAEKEYHILVQAPFWQRAWFLFCLGAAAIAFIVVITIRLARHKYREQLRQLEKQRAVEAERNRIGKDMHDEIGSGLTQIALLSELMQTQEKPQEDLKKDVRTIAGSARQLVESMSEIIWALNPQNDTLENLLAYLREQTAISLEPFDIAYQIDFPDAVPMIYLGNEERRNLFLVAKEAVNNALKHACATELSISMQYHNNVIRFCVCDNGRGINRPVTSVSSNGLKNMRKRMDDIGGSFELQSTGCGTTVQFCLPVKPEHGGTTFFTSTENTR